MFVIKLIMHFSYQWGNLELLGQRLISQPGVEPLIMNSKVSTTKEFPHKSLTHCKRKNKTKQYLSSGKV